MNRADLHAIDAKLNDCNARLAAAREDADRAHLVDDIEFEHEQLVAKRTRLVQDLGLLVA